MEVHPPDHPIMTWKQFLIHMSTICLGLLIALGLEQGVEALHRHHQRHQLEADLRGECIQNLRIAIANVDSMELLNGWQTQQLEELDRASAEGRSPRYIPRPPGYQSYRLPSESIWTVAQSGTTLNLIPRAEAERFAHPYALMRLCDDDNLPLNHLLDERSELLDGTSAFVPMSRFSPQNTYDLSHMTKENLARFRDVTARIVVAARGLEGITANLYNFTWGTLHGYTDDENFRRKAEFFDAVFHGGTAAILKKFPIPDENTASPKENN